MTQRYLYRGHLYRAAAAAPAQLVGHIREILDLQARGDTEMFADVQVLMGPEAARVRSVSTSEKDGPPVALTYDGAGYDYLSYQGEMAMMGNEDLRMKIIDAAQQLGYTAEDKNSWSMTFWPE